LADLEAIAIEAQQLHCQLKLPQISTTLERLIVCWLWNLLNSPNLQTVEADALWIQRLVDLSKQLHLYLRLDDAQELYYKHLHEQDSVVRSSAALLELGKGLAIAVGNGEIDSSKIPD
jgi:hypothetical protein